MGGRRINLTLFSAKKLLEEGVCYEIKSGDRRPTKATVRALYNDRVIALAFIEKIGVVRRDKHGNVYPHLEEDLPPRDWHYITSRIKQYKEPKATVYKVSLVRRIMKDLS